MRRFFSAIESHQRVVFIVTAILLVSIPIIVSGVSNTRDFRPRASTAVILRPTTGGRFSQFDLQYPSSGSFVDKIKEVTADGDDTYIEATITSASDKSQSFNHQTLTAPSNAVIESVKVYAYAKKIGTNNGGISGVMNDSQSEDWCCYTELTQSYSLYSWSFPNFFWGDRVWTVSRLNSDRGRCHSCPWYSPCKSGLSRSYL